MKKMNYFYLIIASLLWSNMLFAQNVNIPDVAFKKYLLSIPTLNTDGDLQNISEAEAASYSSYLYIYQSEIESVEGLQSFTSITGFRVYGTKITTLPLLTSSNLTEIYCDSNQITSIPTLPSSVKTLSCKGNKINTLNNLPANLENLYADNNQISSLSSLPSGLKSFSCAFNQLTTIPTLPNGLIYLNISNNNISDLTNIPLSVTNLNCSHNNISSFPTLNNQFEYINLIDTKFTCLPFLPSTLKGLYLNTVIKCLPNKPLNLVVYDENYLIINPIICEDNNSNACKVYPTVSGKIYYDANNDNIFTSGIDLVLKNTKIGTSNNQFTLTDNDGDYKLSVEKNNFNYTLGLISSSLTSIPVNYTINFQNGVTSFSDKDFIIKTIDFDTIHFTDNNFRQAILNNSLINNDPFPQFITKEEAKNYVGEINISGLGIMNIEGIQYFTKITRLDCYYNNLSSIPTLSNSIQILECGKNELTSLPTLPNQLLTLRCGENQITSLPVIPNTLLELSATSNLITQLPSQLPINLNSLFVSYNKITSLPTLPNSLNILYVDNNQLSSIPNLPFELKTLNCSNNKITDIQNLPANLIELNISNNSISVLPLLPNKLEILNCSYNQIQILPALANSLSTLAINDNQIAVLPNELPTRINSLSFGNNKIKCIPFLPASIYYIQYNSNLCLPNIPNANVSYVSENFGYQTPKVCNDINNVNACNVYSGVSGHIYMDADGDKKYNKDVDYPYPYSSFESNNIWLTGNNDGEYDFSYKTIDKTYTIIAKSIPIKFSISPQSDTVSFKTMGEIRKNKDFILTAPVFHEVAINLYNTVARPGFNTGTYIKVQNNGSVLQNAEVNFTYDNTHLNFISSSESIISTTNNSLKFNITDLKPFEIRTIFVEYNVNSKTALGTILNFEGSISISETDDNLTNNTFKIGNVVQGSYDPNDIAVNHGNNVWIVDIKNNVDFDYTIRFQNTGTDTAFTVIVKDTLPSQLNLSTIKTLTTSHNYTFSLIGNVATWTFKKINLPDSTTNKIGSNGFIKYTIKPLTTLQVDEEIKNTAHIYFDFNEAIITNTVNTKVFAVVGLENESTNNLFTIFPNPNNGTFTVNTNNENCSVEVSNITGEIVYQTALNETTKLDLQNLAKGLYLIKVVSNEKSETKKLVIE
ncbi:MAG: hypothetical protein RLZZ175_1687 [Bacteroidota bacterium]|jgi:Leucine-rich repeat (LRR) protein